MSGSLDDFVAALFVGEAGVAERAKQSLVRQGFRHAEAFFGFGDISKLEAVEKGCLEDGLSVEEAARIKMGIEAWQYSGEARGREPGSKWWLAENKPSVDQLEARRRTTELRLAAELDRWRVEAGLRDAAEAKLDGAYRDVAEAQSEAEDALATAESAARREVEAVAERDSSAAEAASSRTALLRAREELEAQQQETETQKRSCAAAKKEAASMHALALTSAAKRDAVYEMASRDRADATAASYACGQAKEQEKTDEVASRLDQALSRWDAEQRTSKAAVSRLKDQERLRRAAEAEQKKISLDLEKTRERYAAYESLPTPEAMKQRSADCAADRDAAIAELEQTQLAQSDAENLARKYAENAVQSEARCRKAEYRRDEVQQQLDAKAAEAAELALKCDALVFERNGAMHARGQLSTKCDDLTAKLQVALEEQASLSSALDRIKQLEVKPDEEAVEAAAEAAEAARLRIEAEQRASEVPAAFEDAKSAVARALVDEEDPVFALVCCMRKRPEDREVAWRAPRALKDVARRSKEDRVRAVASGALHALIGAAQHFQDDPQVTAQVAKALGTLCFESDAHRTLLADAGGIDTLLSALTFTNDASSTSRKAAAAICAALANLAHNSDSNRTKIAQHETAPIKFLVKQNSDVVLTAQILLLFSTLAASDASAAVLVEQEAHVAVAAAMCDAPDNFHVQNYGCWTLANLKLGPHFKAVDEVAGPDLARVALAKHGGSIATHASILLPEEAEAPLPVNAARKTPQQVENNNNNKPTSPYTKRHAPRKQNKPPPQSYLF